jgi:hypothetical protein
MGIWWHKKRKFNKTVRFIYQLGRHGYKNLEAYAIVTQKLTYLGETSIQKKFWSQNCLAQTFKHFPA